MKNAKTNRKPKQQGDVLFRPIEELPQGAVIVARDRCVVAHGESGHSHVVESPGARLAQYNNVLYLDLPEVAAPIHEEHHKFDLEPGVWEIGRVQEYDYFSKMVRSVID